MSDERKFLVISQTLDECESFINRSIDRDSLELVSTGDEASAKLSDVGKYRGIYISESMTRDVFRKTFGRFLELLPQGIMVLDANGNILWTNQKLKEIAQMQPKIGEYFYKTLPDLDIDGPYYSPLSVAKSTKEHVFSSIKNLHGKSYQFHILPILTSEHEIEYFLAGLEDVTTLTDVNQKLQALHDAAGDLIDLTPEELLEMDYEDRVELLKSNILKFIDDILQVDVIEIRILNPKTKELEPLLHMGISEEAAKRKLFASTQNNGVTGFVAKLGKSYSIEDTQDDPLFIASTNTSKSSFTVPLKFHDQVIGTMNVESPKPRAFSAVNELLIKLFARDVAIALHTLELLSAEKAGSVAASAEAIHAEVALPIDQILNDAVNLNDRYIGLDLGPKLSEKLHRILKNARYVKSVIHKVGEQLAPGQAHPTPPISKRPLLVGKHFLVVDNDKDVLKSAHKLLVPYGCTVETAEDGAHALMMARNSNYDLYIGAITLPDMDGYQFMLALIDLLKISPPPYIMMAGFGYDANHTQVKASRLGLQGKLYKPFHLDQLLTTVERVLLLHQNQS